MIRVEVNQGGNEVESVCIDKNGLGVYGIVINYQKRWCEWTTGSGSLVEDGDDNRYESFYVYDIDHDEAGEPYTRYGNITEVNIYHDGELDHLHQVTTQCKDQLHVLYLPYELINDNEMVARWESEETQLRYRALDEELFNV